MDYLISVDNGIATFMINRPEKRNAVNSVVMDGLDVFCEQVKNDSTIAFVVITGAGSEAFCSGGDIAEFHGLRTASQSFPMLSRIGRVAL